MASQIDTRTKARIGARTTVLVALGAFVLGATAGYVAGVLRVGR